MKKRGRGIGCNLYGVGYGFSRPDHAAATIEVGDDGTATILSGGCDMGQGANTIMCQIAAEALGIPYENVRIYSSDSVFTPDSLCSSASRQTFVGGRAVQLAAEGCLSHMLDYAAELLKCPKEDLISRNNMVYSVKDNSIAMPFPALAMQCHLDGKQFMDFAWYDNTTADVDHDTNQGDAYATYIYATQVADIEIDTDTGDLTVLRVGAAHDVGIAINPMLVEQQIEGAVLQGMGYGMMEDFIVDKGVPKTTGFNKFLIPTAKDAPDIYPMIVESDVGRGPYGAKGVGEGAIIPTAVAIADAVYDAIGVRFFELPITPEKILAALAEKEARGVDRLAWPLSETLD